MVGLHGISEVKGEQGGAECSPEQAEEQKDTLVAPSFVFENVEEPQLDVHHQEQSGVQGCIEDSEAKLDGGGDGWEQGDRQRQDGGVGRRVSRDWSFHWSSDRTN